MVPKETNAFFIDGQNRPVREILAQIIVSGKTLVPRYLSKQECIGEIFTDETLLSSVLPSPAMKFSSPSRLISKKINARDMSPPGLKPLVLVNRLNDAMLSTPAVKKKRGNPGTRLLRLLGLKKKKEKSDVARTDYVLVEKAPSKAGPPPSKAPFVVPLRYSPLESCGRPVSHAPSRPMDRASRDFGSPPRIAIESSPRMAAISRTSAFECSSNLVSANRRAEETVAHSEIRRAEQGLYKFVLLPSMRVFETHTPKRFYRFDAGRRVRELHTAARYFATFSGTEAEEPRLLVDFGTQTNSEEHRPLDERYPVSVHSSLEVSSRPSHSPKAAIRRGASGLIAAIKAKQASAPATKKQSALPTNPSPRAPSLPSTSRTKHTSAVLDELRDRLAGGKSLTPTPPRQDRPTPSPYTFAGLRTRRSVAKENPEGEEGELFKVFRRRFNGVNGSARALLGPVDINTNASSSSEQPGGSHGTRKLRRIIVPPVTEGSVPSRDPRILSELDRLRAQAKLRSVSYAEEAKCARDLAANGARHAKPEKLVLVLFATLLLFVLSLLSLHKDTVDSSVVKLSHTLPSPFSRRSTLLSTTSAIGSKALSVLFFALVGCVPSVAGMASPVMTRPHEASCSPTNDPLRLRASCIAHHAAYRGLGKLPLEHNRIRGQLIYSRVSTILVSQQRGAALIRPIPGYVRSWPATHPPRSSNLFAL
ncbi:hypothetical protein B0H11DRAFT_2291427 [Mycena galericulata]|nr:hypothetical protein B0H11DRAFT_2291427 [Mycena galericulata]